MEHDRHEGGSGVEEHEVGPTMPDTGRSARETEGVAGTGVADEHGQRQRQLGGEGGHIDLAVEDGEHRGDSGQPGFATQNGIDVDYQTAWESGVRHER